MLNTLYTIQDPTKQAVFRQAKKSFLEKKNDKKYVSNEEQLAIIQEKNRKITSIALGGLLGCAAIAMASYFAIISGKCDRIVNNIATVLGNVIGKIDKFLHNSANSKGGLEFDSSRARKHLNNIGVNKQGLISGAHEIKECIETLKQAGGNIKFIKESKTKNGLWEIGYEINGKMPDEPKTVYISEKLSEEFVEDLINLCKKYNNNELETMTKKIIKNKKFNSTEDFIEIIEQALKEGCVIKTRDIQIQETKARNNYRRLEKQLKHLQEEVNTKKIELEIKQKEAKQALENYKKIHQAMGDFDSKAEEFKRLKTACGNAKQEMKNLEGELLEFENKVEKAKKHYDHTCNSVNIFGTKDGKLFASFAHYEGDKLVVDSYFPIANGSRMQEEYLAQQLNDNNEINMRDFKYIIGASREKINKFINKLLKEKEEIAKDGVRKIGATVSTIPIIASNIEIEKLNKEREKAAKGNSEKSLR